MAAEPQSQSLGIKQGEDRLLDDLPGAGTGIRCKIIGLSRSISCGLHEEDKPFKSIVSIDNMISFFEKKTIRIGPLRQFLSKKGLRSKSGYGIIKKNIHRMNIL